MALGTRIPLAQAERIANVLVHTLTPVVERVEIAGSVRRRRKQIADIELVVKPYAFPDMFGREEPAVDVVERTVRKWGRWVKGGEKYMQVEIAEHGIKADVFVVTPPAEWGPIMAIRTGPATLGHSAVTRLHAYRLQCSEGRILRKTDGVTVACPTEEEFFRFAGLPCLPPDQRDSPAAMRPVDNISSGII